MRIGIDFDNTIASYDNLMHRWAVENGLIASSIPANKRVVRDAIRELPEGESRWRALQAFSYGPGMHDASPMPGVDRFLSTCRSRGVPVWVVSHKTQYSNFTSNGVDLREAARRWLAEQGFTAAVGDENIYFEDTRRAKVERIRALGLTHFVDDLEEVFLDESFPGDVVKILLSADESAAPDLRWHRLPTWSAIHRELLAG